MIILLVLLWFRSRILAEKEPVAMFNLLFFILQLSNMTDILLYRLPVKYVPYYLNATSNAWEGNSHIPFLVVFLCTVI